MSTRTRLVLSGLLVTALLGWGAYWFLSNHERQLKEVRREVSPQARRNPLLAAERFLTRIGLAAQSVSGRDRLLRPPADTGVLLVHRLGPSLPPEREAALLAWVEGGGSLILSPTEEWSEEEQSSGNHLLDELGVRLRIARDRPADSDDAQKIQTEGNNGGTPPVALRYGDHAYPIQVEFDNSRTIEDTLNSAQWTLPDSSGAHIIRYALGAGQITVLSDDRFLTNDAVGHADHALLLALLMDDHPRAWLLYSSNMPPLPELLWSRAPYLMMSTVALALLWLWHLSRRSGPLGETDTGQRRNLLEHLEAAAAFAWRADGGRNLFRLSQQTTEQAWRRRHPTLGRLSREEACAWIGRRSGLPAALVNDALSGRPENVQAFVKLSRVLQKLATGVAHRRDGNNHGNRYDRT